MTDTSSQTAPPRDTLQAEIAYQTSPAGGKMTTFIIRDKTGTCNIPAYTNARLINCTLQSLVVSNASILYLNTCTLEGTGTYNVTNSAVLAESIKVNAPVTFTNSKVEFSSDCKIGQNITLRSTSYLKSNGNTWQGKNSKASIAITALDGSRVESIKDAWSQWSDYFWKATTNSIIKVTNPVKIDHTGDTGGGLSLIDDSSVMVLSHPLAISLTGNTNPVFTATKNSRIELYNTPSVISDSIIFQLDTSKGIIRNVTSLKSNKEEIGRAHV